MIKIKNLGVNYSKQGTLIDLSLDIPGKSFVSILGPNGAGKTTLLKVMLGLISNYSGSVKVFDLEPGDLPAQWVGYVPQVKTLDLSFPARAKELVMTGLRPKWPAWLSKGDIERVNEALGKVGALNLSDRLLNGLSGGELQRVYLARALIRKPRLIILDEPTTGIDTRGEEDIYMILEEYQKNNETIILMATHDWDVALHHSSHSVLLNHYLIGFGPPKKILREECLRRAFGHEGHAHSMYIGETCND